MRFFSFAALAPSVALLMFACQSPRPPADQSSDPFVATDNASAARVGHVLVIGVDGMSPDGVRQATTPVLDSLMAHGSFTLHARAVLPSSSSSNWASMIMAAGPEQHGITSNEWERDRHTLPASTPGSEAIFPTIFGQLRAQRPEAEIGAIYHWEGFGRLFEKRAVNYDQHGDTEEATTQLAEAYLKEKRPQFLFVHLDHVDHWGHEIGHGTPEYYRAVERADSLIGRMVRAAQAAGLQDDLLVLVTADHGGLGKSHGGETLAEMEIPFILAGKGIKPHHEIAHVVNTTDNAATVAFAFGLTTPYAWIGKPVTSAFEGFADDPDREAVSVVQR
ncbi:alkaline phosphatase family protein [Catalinimonas alkaloidigena]|nr:alkaline phosphatase [Catalinimonas alkaloidigena]